VARVGPARVLAPPGLAGHGLVTAPDGAPFAATGFIVNCPIISQQ
jgi:hypothetical protein